MAELRQVFEMVTKQTEPDVDAWREQERRQRRTSRNRKVGALAITAAIGIVAVVVVIRAADDGSGTHPGSQPTGTKTEPIGSITDGPLDAGRYIITTYSAPFNASHRITIDVADGYEGVGFGVGLQVLKTPVSVSGSDTGVALYDVGYSFADACNWEGTQSPISSADELVAALATQQGSAPIATDRRRRERLFQHVHGVDGADSDEARSLLE